MSLSSQTVVVGLRAALLGSALASIFTVQAEATAAKRHFDIPAQEAGSALREYAKQSGQQVLFPSDGLSGRSAPSLQGEFTSDEAVQRLAAAAGLVIASNDGHTVLLSSATRASKIDAPAAIQLAQAEPAAERPAAYVAVEPPRPASGSALEEVVITATRQTDTVNRVALSITAQTQKNLDQKGIKTVAGLVNQVPGLTLTQNNAGVATIAIRGVSQSGQGAATTGFYLDDIPLQKRAVGGVAAAGGNGTPVPALFDLERVEVLRGPQGTLYGGSSEGGTVRYITPTPSLTDFSTLERVEATALYEGDPSVEFGVAAGGPIIKDKLGFRASYYQRSVGGFIDYVMPGAGPAYTVWKQNADSERSRLFRGVLLWAPTENAKITVAYLSSADRLNNSRTGSYNLPVSGTLTVPDQCYNVNATPTRTDKNRAPQPSDYVNGVYNPNILVGGKPIATTVPVSSIPIGDVDRTNGLIAVGYGAACSSIPGVTHITPGGSYGPYNFSRYQSVQVQGSPTSANLQTLSLTFDYQFPDGISAKSVTSYVHDQDKTFGAEGTQAGGWTYFVQSYQGATRILQGTSNLFAAFPTIVGNGHFVPNNKRYGVSEELRFSSAANARPFNWVGGVYFSNYHTWQHYENTYDLDTVSQFLFGLTGQQRYGLTAIESKPGLFNIYDAKTQVLHDLEVAAFFEGNYWFTDKLKLTGGIRFSRTEFDFNQLFYGPITGVGSTNPDPTKQIPSPANGSANSGSVTETPSTPKLGLQYQMTSNDMIYATIAKGTRAGGINAFVSPSNCGVGLNQYGLTFDQLPTTYKGDSVWSYELGGKFRVLDNRMQLNGAIYHIDWKDAQLSQAPPGCGLAVTYNLTNGGIVSEGAEIEAQASLFSGLTANLSWGWNNSYYGGTNYVIDQKTGLPVVKSTTTLVVQGQRVQTPQYRMSGGLNYNFELMSLPTFARLDWTYSAAVAPTPYGLNGWTPDASGTPATELVNLRAGTTFKNIEANVFVNNLLYNKKGAYTGGRTGCVLPTPADPNADCHNYNGYTVFRTVNWGRPPEVGISLTYRH